MGVVRGVVRVGSRLVDVSGRVTFLWVNGSGVIRGERTYGLVGVLRVGGVTVLWAGIGRDIALC